jgi:hypothetical protein
MSADTLSAIYSFDIAGVFAATASSEKNPNAGEE